MGCLSVEPRMVRSTRERLVDRVSSLVKVARLTGAVVWLTELATPSYTLSMARYSMPCTCTVMVLRALSITAVAQVRLSLFH